MVLILIKITSKPTNNYKRYSDQEIKSLNDAANRINTREDLEEEARKLAEVLQRSEGAICKQLEGRLGKYWTERF